jgi:hypothetical protein
MTSAGTVIDGRSSRWSTVPRSRSPASARGPASRNICHIQSTSGALVSPWQTPWLSACRKSGRVSRSAVSVCSMISAVPPCGKPSACV